MVGTEGVEGRLRDLLGPIRRFVGAVGGLGGCEADAMVALDLWGEGGRLAD